MGKSWKYHVGIVMLFASSPLLTGQTSLGVQKRIIRVKPLRAYRPKKDIASFLVAPPYNCLNPRQARDIAGENQFSFLHISRPESDYDDRVKPYDKVTAYQGKSRLQEFIGKGLLVQDSKPSFYLYEQQRGDIVYWSIMSHVAVDHYTDGLIKPHEAIFPQKKQALIDFIRIENAHVDPVLLMHKSSVELDVFVDDVRLRKPDQCFTSDDGTRHTIWVVDDIKEVMLLEKIFETAGPLYIADGHHRCAAAAHLKKNDDKKDRTGKFDYMLAALIPENHITLLPYHRLIKGLNGLSTASFLNALETSFIIEEVASSADALPVNKHTFGMYLDRVWYRLTLKKKIVRHYKKNSLALLDMNLLNRYLFKPLLDIGSLTMNGSLECVGGHVSLDELAKKCDKKKWRLAFAVSPVSTKQFMRVVDAGMLMLPKTTWFEPKLWQGLFVQMLE